jgi:hypothetical protein
MKKEVERRDLDFLSILVIDLQVICNILGV